MIISELNLKTGRYDKTIADTNTIQIEVGDVTYNISHNKNSGSRITIHIADGGRALSVYPQAANAITLKPTEYA